MTTTALVLLMAVAFVAGALTGAWFGAKGQRLRDRAARAIRRSEIRRIARAAELDDADRQRQVRP